MERGVDAEGIARQADLSANAKEKYAVFMRVLAEHYYKLLQTEGDTYEDLLISAYDQSKSLLAYIKKLGAAEKALNNARELFS